MPLIKRKISDTQKISKQKQLCRAQNHAGTSYQQSWLLLYPTFRTPTAMLEAFFNWVSGVYSFLLQTLINSLGLMFLVGFRHTTFFLRLRSPCQANPNHQLLTVAVAVNTSVPNLLIYCMWPVPHNSDWRDFCCQPLTHNRSIWLNVRNWQRCGSDLHSNQRWCNGTGHRLVKQLHCGSFKRF